MFERSNAACNVISQRGCEGGATRKYDLQNLRISTRGRDFALTAQAVIRCIARVADAYATPKANKKEGVVKFRNIEDILGADLGVANIAFDSNGRPYTGAQIEKVRSQYALRRAILQRHSAEGAKRRLKKLSGKESRFRKQTNHIPRRLLLAPNAPEARLRSKI